jgi:hypothetical protein
MVWLAIFGNAADVTSNMIPVSIITMPLLKIHSLGKT